MYKVHILPGEPHCCDWGALSCTICSFRVSLLGRIFIEGSMRKQTTDHSEDMYGLEPLKAIPRIWPMKGIGVKSKGGSRSLLFVAATGVRQSKSAL